MRDIPTVKFSHYMRDSVWIGAQRSVRTFLVFLFTSKMNQYILIIKFKVLQFMYPSQVHLRGI
jgi:hypothetical protein